MNKDLEKLYAMSDDQLKATLDSIEYRMRHSLIEEDEKVGELTFPEWHEQVYSEWERRQDSKCLICGGSAGRLNEHGNHHLCEARKERGLPIPSLGDRCPTCNGSGRIGKGGVFLSFDLGPATIKKSIEAQFPICKNCRGTGKVNIPK